MGFLLLNGATASPLGFYQKFDPIEGKNKVYRAETGAHPL
jgi:hypothetical protein